MDKSNGEILCKTTEEFNSMNSDFFYLYTNVFFEYLLKLVDFKNCIFLFNLSI